jgi:hypothetical protein
MAEHFWERFINPLKQNYWMRQLWLQALGCTHCSTL